ncbi:MAG TPA: glutaminyl-peptide cyclotransferase [Candidatus Hydrogenedentes bacterium]|nr:glutaminyl-peptide cyclotransferase [Candidatus Hydrogenedentota bacterium]HPG68473.1 glutaminyl-peptide cyclotransferase [Candidatus Hydrogenedentota bacterium]
MKPLVTMALILAAVLAAGGLLPACPFIGGDDPVPSVTYHVVNTFPHDPEAFTQGLLFHEGVLYESTGLYNESSLRRVALETGEILAQHRLSNEMFGEGLALWQDRLFQLTWKESTAFVYDRTTLEPMGQFHYPGEGWGLTSDGKRLIMSDGTATLRFLDPETFGETGRVLVRASGQPVTRLNELEYVRGEILANVWRTDRIARISPKSGKVLAWIDLKGLPNERGTLSSTDVLNGIAYDEPNDRLFVTGKRWPKLFEIQIVE